MSNGLAFAILNIYLPEKTGLPAKIKWWVGLGYCWANVVIVDHVDGQPIEPTKANGKHVTGKHYKNPAALNIIESYFFNQTEVHI